MLYLKIIYNCQDFAEEIRKEYYNLTSTKHNDSEINIIDRKNINLISN